MNNKALVVIDIQNDITKHYRDIIGNINAAIEWAMEESMQVVYIKHNNITAATRTFKPGSKGEELVPEMKVVSDNIFVKTKSNALTSEAFSAFIAANGINEFYVAGADATGCVKSRPEETPRDARLLRKQRLRFSESRAILALALPSVSRLERSSRL